MTRLLTLGHGTLGSDELATLIRDAEVELLVDVRTVPKSRRHPHFRREAMELWVPELSGSAYDWRAELGGFRKPKPDSENPALRHPAFRGYADYMQTGAFRAALDRLLADAAVQRISIMCSESVWWRCHRRLISDAAALLHDIEVLHLMHDGKLRPHVPTEGVRTVGDGTLRYDRGEVVAPTGFEPVLPG